MSDVYLVEETVCKASLNAVDWKYNTVEEALKKLRCDQCHSSLIQAPHAEDIYPMIDLHCKSCGEDFSFYDVLEQYIEDSLAADVYLSIKDGGNYPYDACQECWKNTFIHEENCYVACNYEMEYNECEMCGTSLSLEDQYNEGKCSYCQYRWEKIMAE